MTDKRHFQTPELGAINVAPRKVRPMHADEHWGSQPWYEAPREDPEVPEVYTYTDAMSYDPGSEVAFHSSATAKTWRTRALLIRSIILVPRNAPIRAATATGTTRKGRRSPRRRYTPAPAAAVTPIMKLLVAVETFVGTFMAISCANTLTTPAPMPSRPEIIPATAINPTAAGIPVTL